MIEFFSKDEYVFINSRPDQDKLSTFYKYWTLKESYVKAIGKGLSIPLNSFTIVNDNNIYFIEEEQNSNYYLYQQKFNFNYALAVCTQKHIGDFKITYFKYNNLV
ncbi:4'-phosphopantetheinyl transferase family protein [Pseudogracilibacillus sp. SO30301A]|uniref:4'-phosphopantetheinyl transferase family protein n=1 Tax=Pseudogracilibacillus sp. SO30301A TaxID=3098291 RepID=UPI00300DCCDA